MAKRFTDTDKWKKKFIRGLDTPYKVLWFYLLDDCDHAGIWHVDIEVAKLRTGVVFDEKIALNRFKDKIVIFDNGDKWFLPDFIDFQYGLLKDTNRMHLSVINLLNKYKLMKYVEGASKPLISPSNGVKDKEQDKDKVKDKDINSIYIEEIKKKEEFKNINIDKELDKFKDYIKSNGKRYKDLRAAFRNWLRNSINFNPKQISTWRDKT